VRFKFYPDCAGPFQVVTLPGGFGHDRGGYYPSAATSAADIYSAIGLTFAAPYNGSFFLNTQ
jgi:hypothetical protein